MKFTILIKAAPTQQAALTAYRFCAAALTAQHTVVQVFFLQNAVYTASCYNAPAVDEPHLTAQWRQLAECYGFPLLLCSGSALRRGIVDDKEAKRRQCAANIAPPFCLSGLGQFFTAVADSDRCIEFAT